MKPKDRRFDKQRKGIYILPNLFTTGNILCGFYAIIASMDERFYHAAWAILVAAVFDVLDGKVARLTHSTSDFGLNYDSLADVISFGMAPALLVYTWVLKPFGRIGWMAAFLFLICGALRLARFNTNASTSKDTDFTGLPIPAAAGLVSSLVIMLKDIFLADKIEPILVVIIVYLLAFLMVSNIKYKSLKKLELSSKSTFNILITAILSVYIIAVVPELMLFIIAAGYAMSGPVLKLLSLKTQHHNSEVEVKH